MVKEIKVVELFAGVGGFRLGLKQSSTTYKTIWANQWEPNKKKQHAFDCYQNNFGSSKCHVNKDIHTVIDEVPEHDLLVGGFPCQDYSVARTQAKGIEGKKGVLWWDINEIIKNRKPKYILLENVDRLLRSPASQRGRDFGVMLRCLFDLDYIVEWRVINAAEYGFAQRRRRIFIFAYSKGTKLYQKAVSTVDIRQYLLHDSFFAESFKLNYEYKSKHKPTATIIDKEEFIDLIEVSNNFKERLFNSGVMIKGKIYTEDTSPEYNKPMPLKDIIHRNEVSEKYFINGSLDKWEFLKGAKKIDRIRPNGEPYVFSEGNMCFPDNMNLPARTMLTSESSVNRSTHVVKDYVTGKLRLLTPIECERLNGFPDNWTDTGMPEKFRYFCMGNALVVPIVRIIGDKLLENI